MRQARRRPSTVKSSTADNYIDIWPEPIPDHLRDYVGSTSRKQGLFALDDADLINLLCIPPFSFDRRRTTLTGGGMERRFGIRF